MTMEYNIAYIKAWSLDYFLFGSKMILSGTFPLDPLAVIGNSCWKFNKSTMNFINSSVIVISVSSESSFSKESNRKKNSIHRVG